MKAFRFASGRFLLGLGLAATLLGSSSYFLQHSPIIDNFDTRQPGLYINLVGIALCMLGSILELKHGLKWKNLGTIILPISLAVTVLYVCNTYFKFHQEVVEFKSGDVVLAGTLLIPKGDGPHPGLVMMHGSGPATRMGNFAEAQSLARHGVAVLIYDKRGAGDSIGGHHRFDGYEALANDGVAAYNFLQSRNDIDPSRIGLWGTSEGGWTAPMAASKIDDLAFLIIVSGGPVTPEEQGAYSLETRLRRQGFSEEAITQALELRNRYNAYIGIGLGREELVAAAQKAKDESWLTDTDILPTNIPVYEELSERQEWWKYHMDTDVDPVLKDMKVPTLVVLGANDPKIPAPLIKKRMENIFLAGNHRESVVRVFSDATHNIVASPANCGFLCPPDIVGTGPVLPWFAPGYLDTVSEWVIRQVGT